MVVAVELFDGVTFSACHVLPPKASKVSVPLNVPETSKDADPMLSTPGEFRATTRQEFAVAQLVLEAESVAVF